ncbi:hypothetical protein [Finegoldia magna]|uniref:hypothetical protein n=1 Tax=Finegoldia magna TaxID=1260 RepID=UPI000B91A6CF|nr:hypothetical protein [Finegoldia magna]MDU5070557.1 hypothetical protein [Finegoldia magna]MDU6552761.1 hypothetical protein [Finegoldia magna]OXZ34191.1 hypothetical protein B9N53_06670 [Finegoldia magna]
MRYDGKIREKLKLVRLNNKEIEYELSYLLSTTRRTFTTLKKVEIINYVDEYYFREKNQIDYDNFYDNLINDINVFKSYRDDVDINVRKENDFNQFVMLVIAIIAILVSIINFDNTGTIIKNLIAALTLLVLADYVYYRIITGSHSEANKLKVINNVIYTLETIKEDMDKNGSASMKYTEMNSNVNDYQSDDIVDKMSTEVKRFTENDKDIYDGLKLTEVREVRTYKATKNKYSPKAMHERKRR